MIHTTIQFTILGMFATFIVVALLERRRSTDRVIRRRWLHVALATGALALTTVPWLFAIAADISAVDWRVLTVSVGPYLLLFGFLLFAQGTLFDLSRDRICRRCGFDLRMREGLTCNECGRVAKSEAHLRAIRPSRTLQVAALLVCAGAFWMWRGAEIRNWGWRGAIPDGVLVTLWPWLPDDLVTGGGGNVPGTFAWRLTNVRSMRPSDAVAERIHRRIERATTIEEFARVLRLRDIAERYRGAQPLSASTIERIVSAMERVNDRSPVEFATVADWLVVNMCYHGIGTEAMEALQARQDRLVALIETEAGNPTLRSRAGARLLITVAREPGQIPIESFLDLLLSNDQYAGRDIARVLTLDPGLHEAVLERAEDDRDPHAAAYLQQLLDFGGPFDSAPELRRRAVEAGLALLATSRENGLHLRTVAVAIGRVANMPADLDTVATLEVTVARQYADDRILRLFERGPTPDALAAIERFRSELEAALVAEMPPAPPDARLDELSLEEWATRFEVHAHRVHASQSAMLLAWAAAQSGGRHGPSAALLEEHAERLWTTLERAAELLEHLQSIGAIDVPALRPADGETGVPD